MAVLHYKAVSCKHFQAPIMTILHISLDLPIFKIPENEVYMLQLRIQIQWKLSHVTYIPNVIHDTLTSLIDRV